MKFAIILSGSLSENKLEYLRRSLQCNISMSQYGTDTWRTTFLEFETDDVQEGIFKAEKERLKLISLAKRWRMMCSVEINGVEINTYLLNSSVNLHKVILEINQILSDELHEPPLSFRERRIKSVLDKLKY